MSSIKDYSLDNQFLEAKIIYLKDLLIQCLPYVTDSYDDNTISKAGHLRTRRLEKKIREASHEIPMD